MAVMIYFKNKWILFALLGVVLGRILGMNNTIDLMARTMWGEARSEGVEGMRAVGHVIKNRRDQQTYFGKSIVDVVTNDKQFSAWNIGDPNREKLLSVTDRDPLFAEALEIAKGILDGALPDITDGADHYYSSFISAPYWAEKMTFIKQIRNHLFFRSS